MSIEEIKDELDKARLDGRAIYNRLVTRNAAGVAFTAKEKEQMLAALTQLHKTPDDAIRDCGVIRDRKRLTALYATHADDQSEKAAIFAERDADGKMLADLRARHHAEHAAATAQVERGNAQRASRLKEVEAKIEAGCQVADALAELDRNNWALFGLDDPDAQQEPAPNAKPIRHLLQCCLGRPARGNIGEFTEFTEFEQIMGGGSMGGRWCSLGEFDSYDWQPTAAQVEEFGDAYFRELVSRARAIIESGSPKWYLAPIELKAELPINANNSRTHFGMVDYDDTARIHASAYERMPKQPQEFIDDVLRASLRRKARALAGM